MYLNKYIHTIGRNIYIYKRMYIIYVYIYIIYIHLYPSLVYLRLRQQIPTMNAWWCNIQANFPTQQDLDLRMLQSRNPGIEHFRQS